MGLFFTVVGFFVALAGLLLLIIGLAVNVLSVGGCIAMMIGGVIIWALAGRLPQSPGILDQ